MYRTLSVKNFKTVDVDNKNDVKVISNSNYIPKNERPEWCKNKNKDLTPNFKCMCNGKNNIKCKFFAYTNADKKDYKLFDKVWRDNN